MTADCPDIAAEIARRKQAADRQSVMAIVGMVAIIGFLTFHPGDLDRTIAALLPILPWFAALSLLIIGANRWVIALQAKALRQASAANSGDRTT